MCIRDSPGLAPLDFGVLQDVLQGTKFGGTEDVKDGIRTWVSGCSTNFLQSAFLKLCKYVDCNGDDFE